MTNAKTPAVTTKKVDAVEFQHAFNDTKAATRYAVYVDGTLIGYVSSHSEESYANIRNSRLRGRFLGYRRSFLGHLDTNRSRNMPTVRSSDAWNSSRARCVTELVTAWQRATVAN